MRKVYARYFVSRENCYTQRVSHRRVVCYPVSRENHLQTNSQGLRITLKLKIIWRRSGHFNCITNQSSTLLSGGSLELASSASTTLTNTQDDTLGFGADGASVVDGLLFCTFNWRVSCCVRCCARVVATMSDNEEVDIYTSRTWSPNSGRVDLLAEPCCCCASRPPKSRKIDPTLVPIKER